MSKNVVVFIPAMCNKTGKKFYIREDLAADDMWVRTYGLPSIPSGEGSSSPEVKIDFSNHRIGPQYKCPHCGNERIFLCTDCGVKACCYDGADTWRCPKTGQSGSFAAEGASSITGSGGSGQ
jgi:predicted RNA-binding Zn-ribbon protein involved in translation (DUF1610 family)